MARPRVQLAAQSDFRGGLNLRRDAFLLSENESPDLLNVDVDPRGGVRLRRGVEPWVAAGPGGPIKAIVPFESSTVSRIVVQREDGIVRQLSGGVWSNVGAPLDLDGGIMRGATFKNKLYLTDGVAAPSSFDGTTVTALTQTYNADLDNPNNGDMPKCKVMAVWQGCMFVANTNESGTAFPNRVRWSHPNFPEDYVDFHFIDIDTGHDGDEITALVPFGDRLLVFKHKSIHAIYGEPPLSFRVYPVSQELGAPSQEATVSTDVGVFFFSWPEGVHLFDGSTPKYLFERLQPAVVDRLLTAPEDIKLGWGDRRLWVSCTFEGDPTVFVLDPTIDKFGAWVRYDLAVGPFLDWEPINGAGGLLAGQLTADMLLRMDVDGQVFDDFGGSPVPIVSHYRTRWFDLGSVAVKKRWKRPEFVLKGGTASTVVVEVFHDYDPTNVKRRFSISSDADGSTGVWNTSTWGGAQWGRRSGTRNSFDRGPGLGTARAVAFYMKGPITAADWGVDSLTVKFVPRPPRS